MDDNTRNQIRQSIAKAEAALPGARKDLEDAKRAGLTEQMRDLETQLNAAEQQLKKLKAVYG